MPFFPHITVETLRCRVSVVTLRRTEERFDELRLRDQLDVCSTRRRLSDGGVASGLQNGSPSCTTFGSCIHSEATCSHQPSSAFRLPSLLLCTLVCFVSCIRRTQVVDTTGAGDAFGAGFIHTWKAFGDVQLALRWGCALGSTVVTRVGGTPKLSVEEDIRPNLLAKS